MPKPAYGGKRIHLTRISFLLFAATCSLRPVPTIAQTCSDPGCELSATTSDHIAIFSINALLGGVTASIIRIARGDPVDHAFVDGFLRGAAGGGISYVGKRVAASKFEGAGLVGRQISALGASTTANAANGFGALDRLMFPLGPIPMRLVLTKQGSGYSVHQVVDMLSAAGVIYGIAARRYSLDWGASLSGGVAVFRERNPLLDRYGIVEVVGDYETRSSFLQIGPADELRTGATTVGGTIFTSFLAPDDYILAHERVHTLQFDFVTATLGDRIDSWTMAGLGSVDRWVKLNLVPAAFGAINQSLFPLSNHDSYPWEREANLLSGYR